MKTNHRFVLLLLLFFCGSALLTAQNISNPLDLQPTSRNYRVKKSFQVGDGTGSDTLSVRGLGLFDGRVGIGTAEPEVKLQAVDGSWNIIFKDGLFSAFDTLSFTGVTAQDSSGSFSCNIFNTINGINFKSEDSTNLFLEVGQRTTGAVHTSTLYMATNKATGAGFARFDLRDSLSNLIKMKLRATGDLIRFTNDEKGYEFVGDSFLVDAGVATLTSRVFVASGGMFVNNGSTSAGAINYLEDSDNGTNFVKMKSPDNLAATYTFTLPPDDGTPGQRLQTDGNAVTSWVTPSAEIWTEITGNAINWQSDSLDALVISRSTDGLYGITPSTDLVGLALGTTSQNARVLLTESAGIGLISIDVNTLHILSGDSLPTLFAFDSTGFAISNDFTGVDIKIPSDTLAPGASVATLTNFPVAGDATGFVIMYINGVPRKIPYW